MALIYGFTALENKNELVLRWIHNK